MATHCEQSECGFSVYRGVIVQWDEDHDERVLDILDNMSAWILELLLVVQEHEANIEFVWKGAIPKDYQEGVEVGPNDGDSWIISSSKSLFY